jgi:hypothetical protein
MSTSNSKQQGFNSATIDPKRHKIEASGEGTSEETSNNNPLPAFFIDDAKPINPDSFPNQGTGKNDKNIPTTIPNVSHMLSVYGITVRYDVIRKKLQVDIPGASGCPDNKDNSAMTITVGRPVT